MSRPTHHFIDLRCPTCRQTIRVWEGVEATCVGREGSHRRVSMERVVGKDDVMKGQMRITRLDESGRPIL